MRYLGKAGELVEVLRRSRGAATAAYLARELGLSERTIYRYVARLRAEGIGIEGEAGVGYLLRESRRIPPLPLTAEELEALVLGSSFVAAYAERGLAEASRGALAKIADAIPPALRKRHLPAALLAGQARRPWADDELLRGLRRAIREGRKARIQYRDREGILTERVVWPCAIAYFDEAQVLAAWCELRSAFRHFRVDRIAVHIPSAEPLPIPARELLERWRVTQDPGLEITEF
ncbi:MAG TPA: YafY family protein [Spirochaetales bacterium]|nr:YafY family protein [Spirochaetales bacterium]HRZ64758.1 YafY family protein [Spirochaetia bacterium]